MDTQNKKKKNDTNLLKSVFYYFNTGQRGTSTENSSRLDARRNAQCRGYGIYYRESSFVTTTGE